MNVSPESVMGTSMVMVGTAGGVPKMVLICSLKVATPPPSGYVPGPEVIVHGAVL